MITQSAETCMSDDVVADLNRLLKIEPNDLACAVYRRAIAEIVRLRTLAGAVTPGPDFVDLRGMMKGAGSLNQAAGDKPKTEFPDWMSMK